MKSEPCTYCDFIGPFVSDEQPIRDLHRMFHEVGRTWNRMFGPLQKAFNDAAKAAADAEKATYRLAGPSEGDGK